MKLYTEEQVKQMIEKSQDTGLTAEYLILTTPAIQLPSEIDIEEEAFQVPYNNTDKFYDESFIKGAKWIKEQILNQNK